VLLTKYIGVNMIHYFYYKLVQWIPYQMESPTRGEGLVTQAQILGRSEVLKPCNSRCKNAKWLVLKHESDHTVQAMVVAESRTCVHCSICKISVSVKQRRKLNPCRLENEEVWRFFADFVDPSFKRIPPDANHYVC